MQLVEVHLRNWRSYRNATFSFKTIDKSSKGNVKNVTLIGAQNGVGKTSLLIALYLGLFGREAMHLIEGIRLSGTEAEEISSSYKSLIEKILHRPTIQKRRESYAMVRIKFQDNDLNIISIKRMWHFSNAGKVRNLDTADGEEVIIDIDNQPSQYQDWKEANSKIADILFPHNIMPCFFFDGEQAQARVDAAGRTSLLSAVKTLYGTNFLDELRQSLRVYYDHEKSSLRREIGHVQENELNDKRDELTRKRELLEQTSVDIDLKTIIKNELDDEHSTLTEELVQIVGDTRTDIEQFAETINILQNQRNDLQRDLNSGLTTISLPLALTKRSHGLIKILEGESVRDRWLTLKEAAQGKASKIVKEVLPDGGTADLDPPLSVKQEDALRIKLEKALEALWSPPPKGCAEVFRFGFLGESDRVSLIKKIQSILSESLPDLEKTVFEWENVSKRLRETNRRYDSIKDVAPRVRELKSQLDLNKEKTNEIMQTLSSLENRKNGLSYDIKELKGAVGQMEKKRIQADPVQKKIDVIYRVLEVLDDATDKLVPLCKEALEERCSFHFSHMISDEFKNYKVKFFEDSDPILYLGDDNIYVGSLSGAQKRAFGLAFTLAIADVSQQKSPIVIDTPVGNMDSKYRARVLEHVVSSAKGQVIILSHDEEISPYYKKQLEPHLSQTILLSFKNLGDGSGETNIEDGLYFEEAINV